MERWIDIFRHTPIRSKADKTFVLGTMLAVFQGFAGTMDVPGMLFVPELMELYPDAKVICTVRDPNAWAKSIDATSQQSLAWYLRLVLFRLSPMRNSPLYLDVLQAGRWGELYQQPGEPQIPGKIVW